MTSMDPLPASPVIIPISDLHQDTAGVVRLAGASGEPVYVTQRGRTTAVLLCRLSYERLRRDLEILSRIVVGDLDISPSEGLPLDEILVRGKQALAEERRDIAAANAAAERQLVAEERAAMRSVRTPTLEQFLASEGLSAWCSSVSDE